ncbi:MAG: PilZ domain-containing protein, partial [Flavobacteriia bacterium]|nr:PilZ domain-containing protein [Flavobacteriia bacterium]
PDFSLHPFLEGFPIYDQRYLPRWEVDHRAYYRLKGAHVIYRTQIRNLNAIGVCLYVANDVCVGQTLELKIYLSQRENFEAQGTVIRTQTSERDLSCAGIVFKDLPQERP